MNCQSFKNQIDEAAFTAELNRHIEACADCKTFREERECLQRLLTKLECVNAPANFEFGVRAKLNSLPAAANGNRVWVRRFVFASPALAAVAVSAFVFTNYNVFSPRTEPASVAVLNSNAAVAPIASPVVSPTQQVLALTNNNLAPSEPIFTKPTPRKENTGEQIAVKNTLPKKSKNTFGSNGNEIISRTSDDPKLNQIESSTNAPRILPPGISDNPERKIRANEALTFFGADVDENGVVKAVRSNTAAFKNGISVGDTVETVNEQKLSEANLETPLQQITVEVSRNGKKRKVTMVVKSN